MKTVCKKLLCLMLVAMMLVSAVPFAFATPLSTEVKCPKCGQVAFYHEGGNRSDASCSVGGKECYKCDTPECKGENPYYYFLVDSPAAGHKWNNGEVTTAATCESDGVRTYTCTVCNETKTEAIAKTGHNYKSEITTPADCENDGVRTYTCENDPAHTYTEVIEATGHNYVGGECTKCGEDRAPYKTITFYYLDSNGNETSTTRSAYVAGDEITLPAVPENPKGGFSFWAANENGTGMTIRENEGLAVSLDTPTSFYAIYNKKSGMSKLTISVRRYVNGEPKETIRLDGVGTYVKTSNDNQMYQYLWAHKDDIHTAAINELGTGYEWNWKFYDYFTDEELTDANLKDNGDKHVYIKMNTKNANEARVLVYVHKSKTSAVHDILEMNGYNAGEYVYLKDVKNFLDDEGYSWSSTSSLYTDEEWDDLLDGESPSGSNGIKINDNSIYRIHIILKGASQSNNADTSNPKTGDYITVAATTMVLAAAALVSVLELKKRKMI